MRNSAATWLCRNPCEALSPSSVRVRSSSSPSTETYTRALRRSGLVSTDVTVTKPTRGSRRSPAMWVERTSFTASLTLRIRSPGILLKSLVGGHHSSFNADTLRKLPVQPPFNPVRARLDVGHGPPDDRRGESGALPQIVMIGLGDRGAEPLVELSLHRLQLLPLSLEAPVLREVQVNLEDRGVAHPSAAIPAPFRLAWSRRPRGRLPP